MQLLIDKLIFLLHSQSILIYLSTDRMKTILPILFWMIAGSAGAQYMYVNTDNLLVRSSRSAEYDVFLIVHAGYKVNVLPYEHNETKAERARFYYISALVHEDTTVFGYVERQYLVRSPALVTARITRHNDDTGINAYRTAVKLYVNGKLYLSPAKYNYASFPYPKYKGGERSFPAPKKREYHQGPHGGCYYMDNKGHKKYVDRKYCK